MFILTINYILVCAAVNQHVGPLSNLCMWTMWILLEWMNDDWFSFIIILFGLNSKTLYFLQCSLALIFVEYAVNGAEYFLSEELLVIFPVISLISSPSKSVKGAANDLLVLLERLLVKLLTMPKIKLAKKVDYPSISRPELIAYRLLQHLWFEVCSCYLKFKVVYFSFLAIMLDIRITVFVWVYFLD